MLFRTFQKSPLPYRGCSELFKVLIKQILGITRGDLYVIETPDHTRAADGAVIDFINLQDD